MARYISISSHQKVSGRIAGRPSAVRQSTSARHPRSEFLVRFFRNASGTSTKSRSIPLTQRPGNTSSRTRRIQRGIQTDAGWIRRDQAWLWSLDGHDADVRDVVAFFQRWHGVNAKNNAGDRLPAVGDRYAKKVEA